MADWVQVARYVDKDDFACADLLLTAVVDLPPSDVAAVDDEDDSCGCFEIAGASDDPVVKTAVLPC